MTVYRYLSNQKLKWILFFKSCKLKKPLLFLECMILSPLRASLVSGFSNALCYCFLLLFIGFYYSLFMHEPKFCLVYKFDWEVVDTLSLYYCVHYCYYYVCMPCLPLPFDGPVFQTYVIPLQKDGVYVMSLNESTTVYSTGRKLCCFSSLISLS